MKISKYLARDGTQTASIDSASDKGESDLRVQLISRNKMNFNGFQSMGDVGGLLALEGSGNTKRKPVELVSGTTNR